MRYIIDLALIIVAALVGIPFWFTALFALLIITVWVSRYNPYEGE